MRENDTLPTNLPQVVQYISDKLDADIYVLSGEISRGMADQFIDTVATAKERTNACLILTTYGGNADAAYLIAKTFKSFYDKFTLYIFGYCKSAGTLIALGADEIVMALHSELGPLDVQVLKENELGSQSSGLDIFKTLDVISEKAFEMFEHTMLNVKQRSGGLITTKMASDIAVVMSTQLLAPVMAQVDPTKLGEMQRAIDIARHYGARLGASPATINRLINDYPSHGFVIDIHEADELFESVRPTNEIETILEKLLGNSLTEQFGFDCVRRPHVPGILMPLHQALKQLEDTETDRPEPSELVASSLEDGNQSQEDEVEGQKLNQATRIKRRKGESADGTSETQA